MTLSAGQRQAILRDIVAQAAIALGWIQQMQYLASIYLDAAMGPGGANEITVNDILVAYANSGFTPNDLSVFVNGFQAYNTQSNFNTIVSIGRAPS